MLSLNQIELKIGQTSLFELGITLLPSSITYIKGPNGSGKTSLLRMVAGVQQPSQGFISFKGRKITEINAPYCNYIGHNLGLKPDVRVFEYLKFWSSIYNSIEALDAAVHYFNLFDILDKKCYELSKGNKKRVELAKLLCCQSDLWLLDEVESNLDETNLHLLHNLIISKANNAGIILISSHTKPTIKSASVLEIQTR